MLARSILLLPAVLIAGCEVQTEPVRADDGRPGQISAENGRVKVDIPGVKAELDLPSVSLGAENMEIDGLKPYPGSKMAGLNINAGGRTEDRVTMRFDAPADRAKVAGWYRDQFKANGFTAQPTPSGFAGSTADGDPFAMVLSDVPGGGTRAEIRLGKK